MEVLNGQFKQLKAICIFMNANNDTAAIFKFTILLGHFRGLVNRLYNIQQLRDGFFKVYY